MHVLVGQSGGPTAAINASLAGVIDAAREAGASVTGMRYGIQGFLDGRTVDLDEVVSGPEELARLGVTPASWLGSCRYKLPDLHADDTFYEGVFSRLEDTGVDAVLYIGGNDSMDTISKLGAWGSMHGSPIRFIGVPKTIDNDLVGTDHTPGYGSAAKFVATAMGELARDADVYDLSSVTFVEIMGRDAGWLTAAATLANPTPDLVLLPETPLVEDELMGRLEAALSRKNTVMVAVSEGVRTPDGHLICEQTVAPGTGVDEFGHLAALSGTSRLLAQATQQRLGCKARAVELSTLQRCASISTSMIDLDEAFELGRTCVQAALEGQTKKMGALERLSDDPYEWRVCMVDVAAVANQVKNVPSCWINPDDTGMSEGYRRYAAPLIEGEVALEWKDGLPTYLPPLP